MENFTEIKNILLKCFNKLSHRNATTITTLLLAVNNGIKTGYIWDLGPPVTIIQIQNFLEQIKLLNLIHQHLILVNILDDKCILNIENFLKSNLYYKPIFIDISKNLNQPEIISLTINQHIQSLIDLIHKQLIKNYKKNITKYIELDLDKNLYCIPTVIGLLAGFPIIYWYNTLLMDDCHCLNGYDLIVYKVKQNNEILISFSYPKILNTFNEIQFVLNNWKKYLNNEFKDCEIIENISKNNNAINL